MPRKTPIGLAFAIARSNLADSKLPYKLTLVATYRCNFRCEMCGIWKKRSDNELTPGELEAFFRRWSQFSWVHLTGGELFVRRDIDDIVSAILDGDRSLYLLNFPTTGWFGDRTVALVEKTLKRGIGRLMTTISLDGPQPVHDQIRGLPGSWDRAIEVFKRLRGIRRPSFQVMLGMTLVGRNVALVEPTLAAVRAAVPDFEERELHLNIGHESAHYFDNVGHLSAPPHSLVVDAIEAHRSRIRGRLHPVRFLENRYQALVQAYYARNRSPLPCAALSSSCFIDPHWNLFPCSIWDRSIGNLRDEQFDFEKLWSSSQTRDLRRAVVAEQCPHCWTPCEAYPTILANLTRIARS